MACGDHIAQTKSEQRRPAHIKAAPQSIVGCRWVPGVYERDTQREVDKRKGYEQTGRPHDEKQKQRKRTVPAVELVALAAIADHMHDARVGTPRRHEEQSRKAKTRYGSPRKDDGLEGIQEHRGADYQAEDQQEDVHRLTLDCHAAGSVLVNKKDAKIYKIPLEERVPFVYSTVTFSKKCAS
jgi:hypothetical protein